MHIFFKWFNFNGYLQYIYIAQQFIHSYTQEYVSMYIHMDIHYITLHYITLHYITLHACMHACLLYKVKHNLSPSFMHSIFPSMNITYNLRNNPEFKTENIHTTYSGSETLTFRGPKHGIFFQKI